MKKLFFVALAAVALAGCKGGKIGSTGVDSLRVETVYDIAYIQMDSLVTGYDRFRDFSADFEAKAAKAQGDLETRARRLQGDMTDLENKAAKGLMTRADIEATNARLQNRAQQFDTDRQTKLAELAEEEQVMTNQVMHAIQQYVAKFNADYRYKMILTTTATAPVIHAAPGVNITMEVLKGLNEEYAAEKAAAPKKKEEAGK